MGAGHGHALYVHEHSLVHRMAPQAKLVAALGMVVCVAITPREAVWAFGIYAAVIIALTRVARIKAGFVAVRLLAIAPFILFAFFIPFIASGETTEILWFTVSIEGLWGTWNILVKALLGASVSILLTATTEIPDIIRGLSILRVPSLFISITTFMIRYLELIADELGRVRVAMASRGYDPRWISQARPIASSAGALFVRSYERGERVHAAMLARGFTGEMPAPDMEPVDASQWIRVSVLVAVFAATAVVALVIT